MHKVFPPTPESANALRLWDISPPVHAGAPVFPGDAPCTQAWAARIGPDCAVNVATLTLSPHTGAHADAPSHDDEAGAAAGALDLAPYLDRCRVVRAIGAAPPTLRFVDVRDDFEPLRQVLESGQWREPRFHPKAAVT